jgi:hypothetical protein
MRVFIGYDNAEIRAHNIAVSSLHAHANRRHDVRRLCLDELQGKGWYTRPTRHGCRIRCPDEHRARYCAILRADVLQLRRLGTVHGR